MQITTKLKETISELYNIFEQSNGVCTDTRTLQHNQIFFALKGDNFDGNGYAEKALKEGAILAVIDDQSYDQGEQYLVVADVLETLKGLARYHRSQFSIPVLGIAGSNGKTTTKELLACAIAADRKVHFTKGNLNNHIGVPLTLLDMPVDTDFAIIEMGANHIGEIAALCQICQPTHGVITNIGHAHIGEFGGREAIIRAKSELFDYLRKTKGIPFINMEDPVLHNMSKRFSNAVTYPNDLCQLEKLDPNITYIDDQSNKHTTALIGAYNFLNLSVAVTVAKFFDVKNPYDALDSYVSDNNRSQVISIGSNSVILDAYNANPDSMNVALLSLSKMSAQHKVAILGDMKELGKYSHELHKAVVNQTLSLDHTETYLVGSDFKNAKGDSKVSAFKNIQALISFLESNPIKESTVLIKGSRSMQMEQLTKISTLWM